MGQCAPRNSSFDGGKISTHTSHPGSERHNTETHDQDRRRAGYEPLLLVLNPLEKMLHPTSIVGKYVIRSYKSRNPCPRLSHQWIPFEKGGNPRTRTKINNFFQRFKKETMNPYLDCISSRRRRFTRSGCAAPLVFFITWPTRKPKARSLPAKISLTDC